MPQAFIAKHLSSALDENIENSNNISVKAKETRDFFSSIQVDMTNFKFDRQEANER